MKIIVCGGRDFKNVPLLWRAMDNLQKQILITLLIEGASDDVTGPYTGADYWANQWALVRGIATIRVRANWKKFGRSAGPIRNKEMIEVYNPGRLVAFPGGAGTANMIHLAERALIPIQIVKE